MKKTYTILTDEGAEFVRAQSPDVEVELDKTNTIELSAEQEKAMIAAGWIDGPIEPKDEKKKGG